MTRRTNACAPAALLMAVLAVSSCEDLTDPEPSPRYVRVDEGVPSNNTVPFGGAVDQRYQQIYAAEALGFGGRITHIAFLSPGQVQTDLATADYLFRLEVTSLPVTGLADQMDRNIGPEARVVIQRRIQGLAYGDTLVFELDTPFQYDPAEGNLLLDVVISDAQDTGQPIRTFSAVRYSVMVGRRPAYGDEGNGVGLVTLFGFQ